MASFVLTNAARDDLVQIADFIRGRKSPLAAERVGTHLRTEMRKLAAMPSLGHVRQDLTDEAVRFWRVYSYLIIYRPETKPLEIVRVLHGARDIETILSDPNQE